MKKCAYCGRENDEGARRCAECGTEFPVPRASSSTRPETVVGWFKVYAAVLCLCYVGTSVMGFFFMNDPEERTTGIVLIVISIPLLAACALPLLLSPRPWLWTYDLVIICIGMTSACFLPACIPLLIAWMKPDLKSYFGKRE